MSLWERWHFFQNAYFQNTIINKKQYKIKIILPAQYVRNGFATTLF